jgi:hypothetical protein
VSDVDFWAGFIFEMLMLIAFSFGMLLIILYPVLKKISFGFALMSIVSGCFVIILFIYFLFVQNPVLREAIFHLFS